MNDLNTKETGVSGSRGCTLLKGAIAAGTLLAFAGISQAQVAAPADDALTMKGITLYGIVDIGLQYESHGAPFSDYFPAGSADIVQKNSNNSQVGATPSNLSQSRVGLQGIEPLVADWSGVFKVETFFNPQSGEISDALKSLTQNNGRVASCAGVTPPCSTQTTNLDSSIAGQIFQQSIVGLASPTYGSFTFGRQNTLLADGIAKYDAQGASQAFSLIGLSGTTAGGGDTQDRRLDSSLKYIRQLLRLPCGCPVQVQRRKRQREHRRTGPGGLRIRGRIDRRLLCARQRCGFGLRAERGATGDAAGAGFGARQIGRGDDLGQYRLWCHGQL